MNVVTLIGRLTRDPEVRYTESQMAIARFSIAIDRGKDRNGESRGADFPNIVVFGKQAENCERFLQKGRQVGVQGRIQTGSYVNKDGNKVYTTEVIADRVEFLGSASAPATGGGSTDTFATGEPVGIPEGFQAIEDEDIPF
ncbi:MAG: single-stranded DNA-binding protein [Anaerovoracaceae bacterium]